MATGAGQKEKAEKEAGETATIGRRRRRSGTSGRRSRKREERWEAQAKSAKAGAKRRRSGRQGDTRDSFRPGSEADADATKCGPRPRSRTVQARGRLICRCDTVGSGTDRGSPSRPHGRNSRNCCGGKGAKWDDERRLGDDPVLPLTSSRAGKGLKAFVPVCATLATVSPPASRTASPIFILCLPAFMLSRRFSAFRRIRGPDVGVSASSLPSPAWTAPVAIGGSRPENSACTSRLTRFPSSA